MDREGILIRDWNEHDTIRRSVRKIPDRQRCTKAAGHHVDEIALSNPEQSLIQFCVQLALKVVRECGTQASGTKDEPFCPKFLEQHRRGICKPMRLRKDRDKPLVSHVQRLRWAVAGNGADKGNLRFALLHHHGAAAAGSFHYLQRHARVFIPQAFERVGKQEKWYARRDGDFSMLTTLHCPDPLGGSLEVIKSQRSFLEKALTRRCRTNPSMAALEQWPSDPMLESSYASAYCGLLNVERRCRPSEASVLGRRQSVAEQTEIKHPNRLLRLIPPAWVCENVT
nr:hypothetical protein [Devosia sp.]